LQIVRVQYVFFRPFFRFPPPQKSSLSLHTVYRDVFFNYCLLLCLFTSSFSSLHRDYHFFFNPLSFFRFVVFKSSFLFLQGVAHI
jgi:hypothetical protein